MQVAEGTRIIGIDLGKRDYKLRVILPNGKIGGWDGKTDPAGRQELYSKLRPGDKIAVEACGIAFIIADEFKELYGTEIYVLNPNRLFDIYMTTKKTDKEDALKLAKTLKEKDEADLPRVWVPTAYIKELRMILSERENVVHDRVRLVNRLHSVFTNAGFTSLKKSDLHTKKSREKSVELLEGRSRANAIRLMTMIDLCEEQVKELTDELKEIIKTDSDLQLLQTIPGVGPLTSCALKAAIGDVTRFSNLGQVCSLIGLVPKIDCSSTQVHYGHITKKGNSYLRGVLVQAAWSLVNSKNGGALKEKYYYMVAHGKGKKKAIIAIARKLAELMVAMLRSKTAFELRRANLPVAEGA